MIARASKDDSAVMREIAIETNRDSSAMKAIAVLGMFFLPGTFVAVSIPFFTMSLWLMEVLMFCNRLYLQCLFSIGMESRCPLSKRDSGITGLLRCR